MTDSASADSHGLRTRSVHAGEMIPRPADAVCTPIFQSSTFLTDEHAAYDDLRYVRLNNTPNQVAVAEKVASLEDTESALVTASGMAAISSTLLSIVRPGDHILAQECLYGGTHELIRGLLTEWGVTVDFVSLEDPGAWESAARTETRLFYVEATTNPLLAVGRLDQVVEFSREREILSVIDNTFPSPVNFRPARFGFDIVLHSATKYLNGHSDIAAGVVAGTRERVESVRRFVNLTGGSLDPHACFLLERGLKTLPLRVRAQNEVALALAQALREHPRVVRVHYPGLEDDPAHDRAWRWFDGFGAMVSFEIEGDGTSAGAAASRALDRLQIALHAPSLGGVETLASRPAVTSHAGLSAARRHELGIGDELIRVSVGIEDPEDLIADFVQALG